ncbi:hypothetical protein ACQKP1_15995 [Allorhizobium sp. NPDC080224]|uniref:hypothetical protein n=1 Tax=Allorhizobium sp. NPDC080224 TaxID=3390547 RepID=UPI003D07CF80
MMPEMPLYEAETSQNSGLSRGARNVDIVGVTGSIPVTPTIRILSRACRKRRALFGFWDFEPERLTLTVESDDLQQPPKKLFAWLQFQSMRSMVEFIIHIKSHIQFDDRRI